MARVERGNVVLHVKDYEVQHYVKLGYNVTDESGNIIKESIPTDVGTLQRAYIENMKRIEELENTIAELTAKLSKNSKSSKKAIDESHGE